MSSTQDSLLHLARQRDPEAIASVANYLLSSKGITATASLVQGCLYLVLQADETPPQGQAVAYVQKILNELRIPSLKQVKISGRHKGATFHSWSHEINIEKAPGGAQSPWDSFTQQATKLGGALSDSAAKVGQSISQVATDWQKSTDNIPLSQISKAVSGTAIKAEDVVSAGASQISQSFTQATEGQSTMNESLDLSQVSESDRLAFYGALFAIAIADEHIDRDEMELIFGLMDLENMSEEAKEEVQSYVIEPPSLWKCLRDLDHADEKLKFALMVNLVDTAWANDEIDSNEEEAIILAQRELKVNNEQLAAIREFIKRVREIRARGLDDNQAAEAMKTAASGLAAVGVPIAAVYFSGSVIGLSAAGITSGLAAVGLGFGMVPGIGIAVLLGTGIFMGVSSFLDLGNKRAKEEFRQQQVRKAQLVIQNMQGAIERLTGQIADLQQKAASLGTSAADTDASREAIRVLTERLKFMQRAVNKRKQAAGEQ